MISSGSTPRTSSRCRSRATRTRVLPDPAGASTRAIGAGWATAACCSGSSASVTAPLPPGVLRRSCSSSIDSRCTSGCSTAGDRAPGTAVDPRRAAVGQQHVAGRAGWCGLQSGVTGSDHAAPPHRLLATQVPAVGPQAVGQALALEAEPGAEFPWGPVGRLGRTQPVVGRPRGRPRRAAGGPSGGAGPGPAAPGAPARPRRGGSAGPRRTPRGWREAGARTAPRPRAAGPGKLPVGAEV